MASFMFSKDSKHVGALNWWSPTCLNDGVGWGIINPSRINFESSSSSKAPVGVKNGSVVRTQFKWRTLWEGNCNSHEELARNLSSLSWTFLMPFLRLSKARTAQVQKGQGIKEGTRNNYFRMIVKWTSTMLMRINSMYILSG